MENNLEQYRFSKIGTNPYKYLKNYEFFINEIEKCEEIDVNFNKLEISHKLVKIHTFTSETTLRQNIDAWQWMGFIIEKEKNKFIKIMDFLSWDEMIEHIKWNLLIPNKKTLINKHKKTIIIKLLTLNDEQKGHAHNTESYNITNKMKKAVKRKKVIGICFTSLHFVSVSLCRHFNNRGKTAQYL